MNEQQRAAMQKMIDALEVLVQIDQFTGGLWEQLVYEAIVAGKEALKKEALQTLSDIHQEFDALEQQEPVAWKYQFRTEDPVFVTSKRDWADNHPEWKETPLYTTPPTADQAARQMRDAAAQKCIELMHKQTTHEAVEAICEVGKAIAALPIPGEEK